MAVADRTRDLTEEEIDVLAWRSCQLQDVGVPVALADLLAASVSDLHVMCKARQAGCSDWLLLDIFGTDGALDTVAKLEPEPVGELAHHEPDATTKRRPWSSYRPH
jgi:hypothetical protein